MAGVAMQYPSYGQMAGAPPTTAPPVGMPQPMTYGAAPCPGFASYPGQPMPASGMPVMQAGPPAAAPGSFRPPIMSPCGMPQPMGGPPQPMRPPATIQRAIPNQPMPLPQAPQGLAATEAGVDHGLMQGDLVKLRGHAAYPHLEGQTLRVEKADVGDGSGMVMIRLEANKFGFVDPNHLEKVGEDPDFGPEMAPGPQQQDAPEFVPGDRVQIVNLEARPQHNGKTAVVQDCSPSGIRVHLDDNSQGAVVLDLMPGYLQLLERGTLGAAANGGIADYGGVVEGGPAAGLQVGEMVRIVGLGSRPQHNGRMARIEVPNSGGNVIVSFSDNAGDGVTKIAVNPAYLEPAEGVQPGAQPGGAHWLTQPMQQQLRVGGAGMMPPQQYGAAPQMMAPQMAPQQHMGFPQQQQVMMPPQHQAHGFSGPQYGMPPQHY